MTARVSKRNLIKGQDQQWRSADSSLEEEEEHARNVVVGTPEN